MMQISLMWLNQVMYVEAGEAAPKANRLTKKLGKQGVNSLFTDLRKIAQHPLLMRRVFSNDRVLQMAKIAHHRSTYLT